MALLAGDIKIADPIKDPLSNINKRSQATLEQQLGRISQRNRAGQIASGRPMGEYTGTTLGKANTSASRGIEDALYGLSGDTSYKDYQNEQEHQRQMVLAKKIGAAYKPNFAQEVLSGIGLVGQVAPSLISAGKSAYNYFSPTTGSTPYGVSSNPYGVDLESILGYTPTDSMLRVRR